MDASTSPVVDVQHAVAPPDDAVQFEGTPDADDHASPIIDDADEQPQKTATGPMQKRRRVTRAWYVPAWPLRLCTVNTTQRRVPPQEDQMRRQATLHPLHRIQLW